MFSVASAVYIGTDQRASTAANFAPMRASETLVEQRHGDMEALKTRAMQTLDRASGMH
jgi:hypothetical protein